MKAVIPITFTSVSSVIAGAALIKTDKIGDGDGLELSIREGAGVRVEVVYIFPLGTEEFPFRGIDFRGQFIFENLLNFESKSFDLYEDDFGMRLGFYFIDLPSKVEFF